MPKKQTVLFKIRSAKDRISTIECWPDYGIVCPNEITSNGNARMVAEQVSHLVVRYGYAIEPVAIDPGDCKDTETLKVILLDAYHKFSKMESNG